MRDTHMAFVGLLMLVGGVGALSAVGGAADEEEDGEEEEKQRLLGPEQGSINVASPRKGKGVFVRGLLCALIVGLCGGSTLVPIKFSPKDPFQSGEITNLACVYGQVTAWLLRLVLPRWPAIV